MKLTNEKRELVTALIEQFGAVVTRKQVVEFVNTNDLPLPRWIFNTKDFRAGRAKYNLSAVLNLGETSNKSPNVESPTELELSTGDTNTVVPGTVSSVERTNVTTNV